MTEELLRKLIEIVTNTAPELWRIANKQVQVDIIYNSAWLVLAILLLILPVPFYFSMHREAEEDKNDYYYEGDWQIWGILSLLLGAVVVFLVSYALVGRIMNPEYYAIKVLMNLVK